jgi:hypothetical protein
MKWTKPNPNQPGIARETQTYNCCGIHYKRWRMIGHHFHPNTIDKTCLICDKLIPWENARYHNRAAKNRENGMTAHGTPKVKVHFTGDQRAEKNREKFRRLTKTRAQMNLTSRGTARIYRPRISQKETAWKELRASMGIQVPDMMPPIERYGT